MLETGLMAARMQRGLGRKMIQWAPSGATELADDNKIVCYWRRQDDGLMKYKGASDSFCSKMGRQVSSCRECQ
jgi:hypothetical protein